MMILNKYDDLFVGRLVFFLFFIAIIILFIAMLIYSRKKTKNSTKYKEDLVSNNEFIKKNREKYEQIMNNNYESLSDERLKARRIIIFYVIICIIPLTLYFIFKNFIFILLFPVILITFGLICGNKINEYFRKSREMYNNTAQSILKEFDSNLEYYPTNGYKKEEYYKLYFAEPCDRFSSEDLIVNDSTGFYSADILVESEHEDDDGNTYYSTEYDGSLAKMDIKDIGCTIILGGLSKYSSIRNKEFQKVLFENDSFNKEFLCFTNNEFTSYKILTPDIMEEFIRIRENMLDDIDIRIINDKLYIRFSGTNGFDGDEGSKDELFKSVAVLEEIMKTMEKVKKIIENKNMN